MNRLFIFLVFILSSFQGRAGSLSAENLTLTEVEGYVRNKYASDIQTRYGKSFEFAHHYYIYDDRKGYSVGHGPYCPSIACFNNDLETSTRIIISTDEKFLKLANKPAITFLLCHEIGHGIAGGVKYSRALLNSFDRPRPYAEGQADFFAVKCMKEAIQDGFLSTESLNKLTAEEDIREVCGDDLSCQLIFQAGKDVYWGVLTRFGKEAKDFSNYSSSFKKTFEEPSFLKMDHAVRVYTKTTHPNVQCRLDTIKESYFNNRRSRCWFNPLIPSLESKLFMDLSH